MELNKSVPVKFGKFEGKIFGGPFRHYKPGTRRLIGVKMAAEINHPHDVSIPTEDFSVPSVGDMQAGLIKAVQAIALGSDVYAGCMGGIGRTGLFMGCLKKCLNDFSGEREDPVKFVRQHYKGHAIETQEQQDYVRTFDSAPVVAALVGLTSVKVQTEVVKEVEYVEKPVYLSPFEWFLRWAGWVK